MKGKEQIFGKNIIVAVLLSVVLVFGIVVGELSAAVFFARAENEAQAVGAAAWSEYVEGSVSESENGIVMQNAAEQGYSFSNTTKKAYTLKELTVSIRLNSPKYEQGQCETMLLVGLLPEDGDFLDENGNAYGIAFIPVSQTTYNVWLVRRNSNATAISGFDNLASPANAIVSETGVISVLLHREADNRWMIMVNGNYQIDLNGLTEINNALDAMPAVHVAVAASDTRPQAASQEMSPEVFRIGSDLLGSLNENGSITNSVEGTTYEMKENGVTFSTTDSAAKDIDLKAGVQDGLAGKLDGLVISFNVNIRNCASYNLDVGLGTYHEKGRYTFWDSIQNTPSIVGSFGMRFNSGGSTLFLLMPRTATAGYEEAGVVLTPDGNIPVSAYDNGDFTMQLLKVNANWCVLVNGRIVGSASDNFQTHLNNTLNSLNEANETVSPWLSYADVSGKTEEYSADITIKGYGTRVWGKEDDPEEGVIGDEITGKLEFSKKQWSSICPAETTTDVKISDEGFVLKGRNTVTGFDIGMNYKEMLSDSEEISATIKMPEKVLASSGSTHAFYGMYIGDATLKNFTEMKTVYLRFSYTTESAADGAKLEVIVWDHQSEELQIAYCSQDIPAKQEIGKETEITVRFVFNEKERAYRVYANGVRVTTPSVEAVLTELLNAMQAKYFYCNASYETDGIGSAWSESAEGMQEMTLVSLCGKKIVNESPETVTGITLDAESLSSSSVNLTWTAAEYPLGDMDSNNFRPVGYVIERIKGDAAEAEKTIAVEGGVETLAFTDTGLDADTYYYYTVYAIDKDGNRLMVSNSNKRVKTQAENGGNTQQPDDNGKDEEKKGCGSFAGVSALGASALLLAGATLVLGKKKN